MDQIWCSCSLPSKISEARGKRILELFTITHPHVELRYSLINDKEVKLIKPLTELQWSILIIGCPEIIWNSYWVSRSRFSCKWLLLILILTICYLKRKVMLTGIWDCLGLFLKVSAVYAVTEVFLNQIISCQQKNAKAKLVLSISCRQKWNSYQ